MAHGACACLHVCEVKNKLDSRLQVPRYFSNAIPPPSSGCGLTDVLNPSGPALEVGDPIPCTRVGVEVQSSGVYFFVNRGAEPVCVSGLQLGPRRPRQQGRGCHFVFAGGDCSVYRCRQAPSRGPRWAFSDHNSAGHRPLLTNKVERQ